MSYHDKGITKAFTILLLLFLFLEKCHFHQSQLHHDLFSFKLSLSIFHSSLVGI